MAKAYITQQRSKAVRVAVLYMGENPNVTARDRWTSKGYLVEIFDVRGVAGYVSQSTARRLIREDNEQ